MLVSSCRNPTQVISSPKENLLVHKSGGKKDRAGLRKGYVQDSMMYSRYSLFPFLSTDALCWPHSFLEHPPASGPSHLLFPLLENFLFNYLDYLFLNLLCTLFKHHLLNKSYSDHPTGN